MKQVLAIVLLGCAAAVPANAQKIYRSSFIEGHPDIILPRAVFRFDVPVIQTTLKAGADFITGLDTSSDLAKYYETRYGLNRKTYAYLKNNKGSRETYSLFKDSLKLTLVPQPDYNKMFYFDKLKKWNKTQGLKIVYSEDGLSTDGEYTYTDKTFDLALKGLGAVASVAGKFMGRGAAKREITIPDADKIAALEAILDDFDRLYMPGGTTVNIDIYKDLKARLQKKYDETFARFFYSTEKTIKNAVLLYSPENKDWAKKKQAFSQRIFAISARGKILVNQQLAERMETLGSNLEFADENTNAEWYRLSVSMRPEASQLTQYLDKREEDNTCLPFNISARTRVTFTAPDEEQLVDIFARVPQFGKLGYVNIRKPNTLNWQYDSWGELKMKQVGGNAVTTDQVGAVQSVVEQYTDLLHPDELTEMKRQLDIIKTRKELDEALKQSLPEDE